MIEFKKIPYFKMIPIIIITLILYRVINNIENVGWIINKILSLLSYFIWGFVIAYLLNPLMMYIERKTKIKRILSITIIYTVFIGIIILVITLVTPNVAKSATDLINNMPDFINKSYDWLNLNLIQNELLRKYGISKYIQDFLTNYIQNANTSINDWFNIILQNFLHVSSLVIKLSTGIVISIYLLKDKEVFLLNIKKFTYCILSESRAEQFLNFSKKVNIIFNQYVVGKFIDSIIVGLICFIALVILNVPYSITISVIIGVTNMIPYFGNLIGLFPACIITLFFSPIKTLEVIIVIAILNILDGWYISPKILGDKIGMSPVLIILGIAVGGGLFGVIGMFLGIPVIAVVKIAVEEFMDKRLKNKDLKVN